MARTTSRWLPKWRCTTVVAITAVVGCPRCLGSVYESSGSSYAELSLEEKNRISHRAAALAQFVAYCREHPEMLQEIELWNTPVAPS